LFLETIFPKETYNALHYCTFNNHWKAFLKRNKLPTTDCNDPLLEKISWNHNVEKTRSNNHKYLHDFYTKFQQKHDKSASEMFENLLKRL
jgi:hypothetical protein